MPLQDLARSLLDTPRWVETRFMLLRGEAAVTGLTGDRRRFVARSTRWPLMSVVGRPDHAFIAAAAESTRGDATVLCATEDGDHVAAALPGWERSAAAICAWPGGRELPITPPSGEARLLEPRDVAALEHVPDELREGIRIAAGYSPVAASLANGLPVAFCYATSITESLWDVSIDTLEEHRRSGHAARAFRLAAATLGARGKWPVWGYETANEASRRLAEKLGFVAAEHVALFDRPAARRFPDLAPSR